jgi:LysM repeat protein
MAWLFDQKEVDPAAAIYHYGKYLRLAAKADNADLAKQRIMACKQALAETVTLGPLTEKLQRQFEQVTDDNKRLTQDNKRLIEELQKWTSYAARLQTLTNYAASAAAAQPYSAPFYPLTKSSTPRVDTSTTSIAAMSASPPSSKTHAVKQGETASLIARKYGVKLQALLAANPSLDPHRLKVGQVLRIPGS